MIFCKLINVCVQISSDYLSVLSRRNQKVVPYQSLLRLLFIFGSALVLLFLVALLFLLLSWLRLFCNRASSSASSFTTLLCSLCGLSAFQRGSNFTTSAATSTSLFRTAVILNWELFLLLFRISCFGFCLFVKPKFHVIGILVISIVLACR